MSSPSILKQHPLTDAECPAGGVEEVVEWRRWSGGGGGGGEVDVEAQGDRYFERTSELSKYTESKALFRQAQAQVQMNAHDACTRRVQGVWCTCTCRCRRTQIVLTLQSRHTIAPLCIPNLDECVHRGRDGPFAPLYWVECTRCYCILMAISDFLHPPASCALNLHAQLQDEIPRFYVPEDDRPEDSAEGKGSIQRCVRGAKGGGECGARK